MPELPDVEIFKQYFNSTSLHKKIEKVEIPQKEMVEDVSSRKIMINLKGKKFSSASRHGKYFFAKAAKDKYLVLHFGMTGSLKYYKLKKEKPEYIRLQINFKNNYKLAYVCPRKLGKISFTESIDEFIKKKGLGQDSYDENFKLADFRKLLKNGRGSIKSFLMNQSHLAGIGNIYADEILFQASVHPESQLDMLDDEYIKRIFRKLNSVLNKAIKAKAKKKNMPGNFLLAHRAEGEECPVCGGKIRKSTISGRSSYFCEKHQIKLA